MNPIVEDILMHYGMPRRSGRYLPKHPIRYRRLPKSRLYTTIIQDFFGSYKGYAGVMQQYIFYYERSIRNGKS